MRLTCWPLPSLRRLARRVTAPVDAAHALGALPVARLLLSTFVTHDALIVATRGQFRLIRFVWLRPGLPLKSAHVGTPSNNERPQAAMFPRGPLKHRRFAWRSSRVVALEAGSIRCNNPVAEQN